MTIFGAYEFADVMPHTITVRSKIGVDPYGKSIYDSTTRQYKCYLAEGETVESLASGDIVSLGWTAYCNSVPIGGTTPVKILEDDEITFPDGTIRPIVNIQNHYWIDDPNNLHNITVRTS